MSFKQKVIIATSVTSLFGIAVFNSVYLPYYSELAIKETDSEKLKLRKQQINKSHGGSRGSVWSNIDKASVNEKSKKDE